MATVSFISALKLVELLKTANKGGGMFVRVASGNRLALGNDPMQPTVSIDLSREQISPFSETKAPVPEPTIEGPIGKASRRSGNYWVEVQGNRIDCSSLRDLLAEGLKAIEVAQPGTLEKLALIKPRSKRIVSHDKKALFDAEHLSEEFGAKLIDGWWYGTNNSAPETNTWIERACECAGLKWGKEIRTSLGK
ncbi:hypothetical protein [Bradyrhizobium liaoningense]|uniref:hypothetical protein n=1 Tax=Bradyrhizobium liaoningense TaxID=43992 RepID=UPI00054D98EA|nr:hypothetical protein [Bradyrhizobium liaoningense]